MRLEDTTVTGCGHDGNNMGTASLSACLIFCLLVSLGGAQDDLTTTCSEYIVEGEDLVCYCVGSCSNGKTPTLTWPDHSDTDRLEKVDINRHDDGQTFTCRRVCGSDTTEVTYTLQVAYGPDGTMITGPSSFIANGAITMNLTCEATVNPTPLYRWSGVSCHDGNSDSTCMYTPSILDDGKRVTVVVTNPKINQAEPVTVEFDINLFYPPQTAPVISEGSGSILTAKDILNCTVTGGKPLVDSVNFTCTSPYHAIKGNTTNTSASSSLTIDTSQATTDNMTCYCSANWPTRPEFYITKSEGNFLTECPAKVKNFLLNNTNKTVTVTESDQRNVTIQCEASGRPGPGLLLIKTSHDGTVTLNETHVDRENVTHTTLDHNITMADWTDMGNYTCVVWNHVGDNDSVPIALNVNSAPRPASQDPEGTDRNSPLNMTTRSILIELLVYPAPLPDSFTYIRYANNSAQTGTAVSSDRFNSHVTTSGPGNNFVTVTVTGKDVPHVGVYRVTISNDFGSAEYFFDIKQPFLPVDESKKAEVGLIVWIVLVVLLVLIIVGVIVAVVIIRRRKARDFINPALAPNGTDADNDSGIGVNGRSSPPRHLSDGCGYASVSDFPPAKQQEGVVGKTSARTAAYQVISIVAAGQVSMKEATPQLNAYQEPWDTKNNTTLAGAPGGPPVAHNIGPKGDEYATVSSLRSKTTITVGQVDKHGKGDNMEGSPANAEANRGDVASPSGIAAASGSPVQGTSSPRDGTDTYDHCQRDGHDLKSTSQGSDAQYSHTGDYQKD